MFYKVIDLLQQKSVLLLPSILIRLVETGFLAISREGTSVGLNLNERSLFRLIHTLARAFQNYQIHYVN